MLEYRQERYAKEAARIRRKEKLDEERRTRKEEQEEKVRKRKEEKKAQKKAEDNRMNIAPIKEEKEELSKDWDTDI